MPGHRVPDRRGVAWTPARGRTRRGAVLDDPGYEESRNRTAAYRRVVTRRVVTVAIRIGHASGAAWIDDGRLLLRRVYNFEYSDTGDNRRNGSVVLLGHRVVLLNVGLRAVPALRTLH